MQKLFLVSNNSTKVLVSADSLETAKSMMNDYLNKIHDSSTVDQYDFTNYEGGILAQGESMPLNAVLY